MSIESILASGFLFVGGALFALVFDLLFGYHDLIVLPLLASLCGGISLLFHWFKTTILPWTNTPIYSDDPNTQKEDSHENPES